MGTFGATVAGLVIADALTGADRVKSGPCTGGLKWQTLCLNLNDYQPNVGDIQRENGVRKPDLISRRVDKHVQVKVGPGNNRQLDEP